MSYTLNEEEIHAILAVLRSNWIPIDLQKTIYTLITKLEKVLEQ